MDNLLHCLKGPREFSLIETILWKNGGYFLLDLHVERLEESARYFSFPCDRAVIRRSLGNSAGSFDRSLKYRVRLLLRRSGEMEIASEALEMPEKSPARIAVSDKRTDRNDVFLRHKTTNRDLYDRELAKYRAKGFFDVIFLNREGEVTEGAITNIVVRKGPDYWTPPVSCGLLPGVYREYLLKSGKLPLKEKVLRMEDLLAADEIFLVNSVRKMLPAVLFRAIDNRKSIIGENRE